MCDRITDSMREAIGETDRRRAKQIATEANGIDPNRCAEDRRHLDQVYREARHRFGGGRRFGTQRVAWPPRPG